MINITDKYRCVGCSACVEACGKQSITMQADKEGFFYPEIDLSTCINCKLCEKVCPLLNTPKSRTPKRVLAAYNKDENVVKKSSSGGVFYELAKGVLLNKGVVFGAKFNENWQVVHDFTTTLEGLDSLLTSKYVQSKVEVDTFIKLRLFLEEGRTVLFSGTPCQVAGLYGFLRKDYQNLITVDFLCHGVPSPKVWNLYLEEQVKKVAFKATAGKSSVFHSLNLMSFIKDVKFREKTKGWEKYRFVLTFNEPTGEVEKSTVLSSLFKQNPYMKGFLNDLYLRPSCHKCNFKSFQSNSDITIGDFWAIRRVAPHFYNPNGVSAVFLNSSKGESSFFMHPFEVYEVQLEDVASNKGLAPFTPPHARRDYFFQKLDSTENVSKLIEVCVKQTLSVRIVALVKRIIIKIKLITKI